MKLSLPKNRSEGFTLIELLIYFAVLTASASFLVGILVIFTRVHFRQTAINEVNNQINFVNNTIQQLVQTSSLIDMPAGVASSTLTLRRSSESLDPTLVYLDSVNKIIYLKEASGDPVPLTNKNVNVTDFSVVKYENPGGHAVVDVELAITYNATNPNAKFSRLLQTAITRVSAATFDSSILPNAGGMYDLGTATSTWRDAYFSGSVGIGVSPVSGTALKTNGDIAFSTSTVGVIFTAPNGSCFRMTITNTGTFATSSVVCP